MAGLEELGLTPEQRGSLVVVKLDITIAGRADLSVVGTDPAGDFPNIPPHWLHLRKELALPEETGRSSQLGDGWRKWSRQHPSWRGGDNAVQAWLAHARSLLLMATLA
ncbi:MAG: hypothetical protein OXU74_10060 [Gemmatimonadota bacterium]|nr:hypothetical protein [Gemmatimonadota bacterium]